MWRWLLTLSGEAPGIPADERRRRRWEIFLIFLAAVVFGFFAVVETWMPRFGDSGSMPGNLVFFLLINLNLILLVLIVFLVIRNFAKLALERRRGILGSRLRTRLVVAFVGLTLIPTTLLFMVSQGFLARAFDSWFSVRVESALNSALDIAQVIYQQAGNSALHFGEQIGDGIAEPQLWNEPHHMALQRRLENACLAYNLARVEAVSPDGKIVAVAEDPQTSALRITPAADELAELHRGEKMVVTHPAGGSDIVRAAVPVRGADGALLGSVLVDYVIGRSVSSRARDIAQSYQEFRHFGVLRQPMKNSYILTLTLITLVVIFAATWFGFRVAKGITVPLQRLSEGTREVAQGNWDHRIEAGADEELATVVISFNQMTAELKQIHGELEDGRRYIEAVLANVTAGVVSIGQGGEISTINRAAEKMLGVEGSAARGADWKSLLARNDLRDVGEMIGVVARGEQDEVERQVKLSGGQRIITALVTVAVLRDEAGARLGVMVFFDDVSHMLRVERMEAWREVARRIAHEIKNPLTPIQLSAQRLRRRYASILNGSDGSVLDECTRTIIRQVEGLKRLVNEFASFARLPPADMAPHDLNAVIDEALVLFREGHRDIGFIFTPEPDLPLVEIDREAIKRAVINLLDNAVAACQGAGEDGGPRIEISTSYRERIGTVQLEVADNGCGIPPEVRGRLFEPYVSTKKDGTGLGLAIVSAIAADHQAYLRVRDNAPRGSRFIIELPLRRRENALHAIRA